MLLSLIILSLSLSPGCGSNETRITTSSGTDFKNITRFNCSEDAEFTHSNCSRMNCSKNSHGLSKNKTEANCLMDTPCLNNNTLQANCLMDTPCLNNNTLQANCSRDLSELKSQTYAEVWKRFDSKGRLTRALIAAVIFLVFSVVISVIMRYKHRVDPLRRWQFRYRKHTGTGGPEDRIYMVETDETLTNDFDSIMTKVDETLVTDDKGFKEFLLENNA